MAFLIVDSKMQNCQGNCNLGLETIFPQMRRKIYGISAIQSLMFVCVLLCAAPNLYAQPKTFQASHVKAVFLYNLANFVSWPTDSFDSPGSPFRICIVGQDPFGNVLDKIVQKEIVKGRQIAVERVSDITDLCDCHILFISASVQAQLPQVLKSTMNCNVLTVGDTEDFARLGGMVGLVRKGNRVYLEVNVDSTAKVSLRISSKLLDLARIVRDERSMGND